jgi:hypothetical protein
MTEHNGQLDRTVFGHTPEYDERGVPEEAAPACRDLPRLRDDRSRRFGR